MDITELSPALGVEIRGLDARRPLGAAAERRLRELYERHHLLLFREQHLDGPEQVRLTAVFGPIVKERSGDYGFVSNARPDGIVREGALLFHSDFAFAREPLLGISLHAIDIPTDGAPTLYANAVRAVELLPATLRSRLEQMAVRNHFDFTRPSDRRYRHDEVAPGSPITEHPAIGRHPRTGHPVLNINEMHSESLVGVSRDESDALLAEVFAVLYDPSNVYEHRWTPGDLIVWDNVALHHGRRTIPVDEPRTLQRVVLGNHTADELVPNLAELLAARY
jgi:alpha-ketoglutarate-dependent taurine dioxygenase